MVRDKANLDIFWIRDESLEETANLPEPDVPAAEIVEDLGPRWSRSGRLRRTWENPASPRAVIWGIAGVQPVRGTFRGETCLDGVVSPMNAAKPWSRS